MNRLLAAVTIFLARASAGCSTSQHVAVGKLESVKRIQTVAQVPNADNSAQMNGHLEGALQKEGLSIKAPLPAGTRKSAEVDALVSYVDIWRWDIAMYLRALTIWFYDAATGDLLAIGQWNDSPLHGFRDSKLVMEGLVAETLAKLRSATPPPAK